MAPFTTFKFVKDQYKSLPLVTSDLSGQTVLVVGANVGLGLEASRHFASMRPARLILACRSKAKGEAAVADIKTSTGFQNIELWLLDLNDFSSVKAFADRYEKEGGGRLDHLVANAAVATPDYEQTKDGWELTLQTNHLSTALLSLLLLPTLAKTPVSVSSPRLTIVSSEVHYLVSRLTEADSDHILNALNDPTHCTQSVMSVRYQVSKLLNVFFTRALSSRLPINTAVAVDVVNPGFCHSELTRNAPLRRKILIKIMKAFLARSTEVGSRTIVHGAIGLSQKEIQGRYLNACQVEEESDYVVSKEGGEVEERLWKETIDILKKADPRIEGIVAQHLTRP